MLSYTDVFSNAGFIVILLHGIIFIIGMNGIELGWNECPTHFTIPENGGNIYVVSTFYIILA